VYTTHYMEEAERLCDRVGIMDRGTMLALDTVPALLARLGGLPVLVIEKGGKEERVETDNPLAELNRRFPSGHVDRFRLDQTSLERVFLNLTGKNLRD
jgi:ABC-2 type transport system ATP-binding protein